jgi:hypothetical protein
VRLGRSKDAHRAPIPVERPPPHVAEVRSLEPVAEVVARQQGVDRQRRGGVSLRVVEHMALVGVDTGLVEPRQRLAAPIGVVAVLQEVGPTVERDPGCRAHPV